MVVLAAGDSDRQERFGKVVGGWHANHCTPVPARLVYWLLYLL